MSNEKLRELEIYTLCGEQIKAEDIKSENDTQYRVWFRTETNLLVNRSFPKDDVLVKFEDVEKLFNTPKHETVEELREFAKHIVKNGFDKCKDWEGKTFNQCKECFDCDGNHTDSCVTGKAEKFIKDIEGV
jgi:hypothetical protein